MKFNSIRFKSIILFSTILFLILLTFSNGIYFTVRHVLYNNLDDELKIKALEVAEILNSYYRVPFRPMIVDSLRKLKIENLNLKNDYINILNFRGQTVIRSGNFKRKIKALFTKKISYSIDITFYKSIKSKDIELRVINFPIADNLYNPYIIQVGTPLKKVNTTLDRLKFYIIINIIIIMFVTSFIGIFFTKSILKPVMEVAKLANNISHKNLNIRLKETRVDEEMTYLIHSFNLMIERLEKSFQHINEFSGFVAHELKTPLAIIKGEIEVALNKKHNTKEYRRVMNSNLEEINRLNTIIKDILLLAKLEYEQDIYKFKSLNLSDFLKEISDNSRILAKEKKIKLTLIEYKKKLFINSDKIHLRRLFFNLLHNAIKYTPKNGQITISTTIKSRKVYINISDTGIGISKQDLNKIFKKFYRVHKNIYSTSKGSGLGLNIAQTIALAHQGKIEVTSKEKKGTTFTIIFPLIKQ